MPPRRFGTTLGAAALLLTAARANAHPTARLDSTRGPGAELCPDASALRSAVAARLGYDPFDASAADRVEVRVTAKPRELVGSIVLRGPDGSSRGDRTLTSIGMDCVELASSLTLAISIAIDPLSMSRPAPAPVPVPAPPPPPPPPVRVVGPPSPPPAPSGPPAPSDPLHLRLAALAVVATGVEPSASPGFAVAVALHSRRLELGVEGRAYLTESKAGSSGGSVSASLLEGTLAPCLRQEMDGRGSVLMACALGSLGTLSSAGHGLDFNNQADTLHASVGARLTGDLAVLAKGLYLRLLVDGLAPLSHIKLTANGADVWNSPSVAAAAGLGIAGEFL